jgi:hypothetical protein
VPLWLVADPAQQPQIGWGLSPSYPHQEAAFFGNIFVTPPRMYYCNGRDMYTDPVDGRLGSEQDNPPYTNPWGTSGKCSSRCTDADYPNAASGYKACYGYNDVITVWR